MQEPVNATATLRANWIAALRSGKYKQGTGVLNKGGCYCCLGVACEVMGIVPFLHDGMLHYDETAVLAPARLIKAIGLVDCLGSRKDGSGCSLSSWNDNGKTFDKIADLLETGEYFT